MLDSEEHQPAFPVKPLGLCLLLWDTKLEKNFEVEVNQWLISDWPLPGWGRGIPRLTDMGVGCLRCGRWITAQQGAGSFGVVWALLSQSGAHTRKGRTALLRWPWLFTCGYHCMNSRDLVGQKPFLDLFLKLLAEASVSDEEMKVS